MLPEIRTFGAVLRIFYTFFRSMLAKLRIIVFFFYYRSRNDKEDAHWIGFSRSFLCFSVCFLYLGEMGGCFYI